MTNTGDSLLHFGAFEADLATGELRRSGRPIRLQPQPFKLLALLLERPNELVTREEIQQRLWGNDTFVDFEQGLNFAIKKIREALNDDADRPRYIETLPRRGYRFIAPVERTGNLATEGDSQHSPTGPGRVVSISGALKSAHGAPLVEATDGALAVAAPRELGGSPTLRRTFPLRRSWVLTLAAALVLGLSAATYLYIHSLSAPKLTDKDTIVVTDFTDTTGDPIFEGALRQGLSAQLRQSPFLSLISDARIAQTLALMGQPRDARVTKDLAREVCQRTSSAASIEGSIAGLGDQYILRLQAVNCRNGNLLAEEQQRANGKEQVLRELDTAATKLRLRLGESLDSVTKYDVPLENATTPSLEALQAESLGTQLEAVKGDWAAAVPFHQRAVSLDPNLAVAWEALAADYQNLGQGARAAEAMRKAYELRDRLTERERLGIESEYHAYVTGDFEARRKVSESWAQTYPRDSLVPLVNLSNIYQALGDHGKSLAAAQNALKLESAGLLYGNLLVCYLNLNRLDEAKATAQEAQARNLDSPFVHLNLYLIDFLEHDTNAMRRESAGLADKPGYGDVMLYEESDTAACAGQLTKARELTQRATDSANRADQKETAAEYEAEAAVREVLTGDAALAKRQAQAALTLSRGRDVEGMLGVALGLAGDSTSATRLASDLDKQFPEDTVVQFEYQPMIRAAAALGGGMDSRDRNKAIEALASAYELGIPPTRVNFCPYPVYLRAQAYLAAGQGAASAAEFKKVLDHPGLVVNQPIGALAHLGLGRAYALEVGVPVAALYERRKPVDLTSHDGAHRAPLQPLQPEALAKARIAYQDFLALWKDADPDLPILRQAKAEYARLQKPE